MGVLSDLIVPGSGTVPQALSMIPQLCAEMKEGEDASKRLHQRLKTIFDELQKLEKKKRLPPADVLDKYVAAVSKTLLHLERYRGKKLVFRLMKHQAMMEEQRRMNEDIDVLVRGLSLVKKSTSGDWKQQFEDDLRVQQELLAASVDNAHEVLAELQDARSQQETMLTLKYEVEHRPEQKNPEMTKLLKTMIGTVIRASMTAVPKLPPWFLPPYEINFDPEPFARGSFATLHRGVWRSDTNVVVKCFLVDGVDMDERTRQNIEEEMNIWHELNHPNVIRLLGASHISTPPFIVCEDATNGDLCSFLARSDSNKAHTWKLLYQVALGLDYIHRKSVVHGDLKLNNILVGSDGFAKLSDFGLSAVRTSAILPETTGETPYTAGALRWRAPECMKKAPTFASDVYSFAMCIIEAAIGEPPFAFLDDDSVHERLRNGKIPDKPDQMAAEVWELVVSMTNADPEKRVDLPDVIEKLKAFADDRTKNSPRQATKPVDNCVPEMTNATSVTSEPSPLDADIIVDILDTMSGLDDPAKEQALLQLVRICAKDEKRSVMYEANAVHVLSNLVKSGCTYYTKLYALQCLKWSATVDTKLSRPEFDALRDSIQDAPVKELASVVNALNTGTEHEKDEAAIRCACIATRGSGGILRDVAVFQPLVALWQSVSDVQKLWIGMVLPLVTLLQSGNDSQTLWAAEAMGGLTTENEAIRAEILRADAITPLVALLRIGSNELKHRTVNALKNLALHKETSQTIASKGAIAPLIKLARLGMVQQKEMTTALIESLVLPSYSSRADIARETCITPLIALVMVGTNEQKETAAIALLNLAKVDEIRIEIAHSGGIEPLVALLQAGTNPLKAHAAEALMHLASNGAIGEEISRQGGIVPLVELAWNGNSQQKFYAVGALSNLSFSDEIAAEIAHEKGVAPLIELVRAGTEQQQDYAVAALRNLASHDKIGAEIAHEGGTEPLINLVRTGTDQQKERAVDALINLSYDETIRSEIIDKGGVAPLIELLRSQTDQQKEGAAKLLKNLASSDTARAEIAQEGGVSLLVELLRNGSEQQRSNAAEAIKNLAMSNDKIRAELVREGSVPLLKALGRSGSSQQKESADRALRQLNGGCCILM